MNLLITNSHMTSIKYHMHYPIFMDCTGAAVVFLMSYPYTVWTRVSCQAVSSTNGLGTRLYTHTQIRMNTHKYHQYTITLAQNKREILIQTSPVLVQAWEWCNYQSQKHNPKTTSLRLVFLWVIQFQVKVVGKGSRGELVSKWKDIHPGRSWSWGQRCLQWSNQDLPRGDSGTPHPHTRGKIGTYAGE